MASSLTNFLFHCSYFAILLLSFLSSMGTPAGADLAIIGGVRWPVVTSTSS